VYTIILNAEEEYEYTNNSPNGNGALATYVFNDIVGAKLY
jgi:hypothetical protein